MAFDHPSIVIGFSDDDGSRESLAIGQCFVYLNLWPSLARSLRPGLSGQIKGGCRCVPVLVVALRCSK